MQIACEKCGATVPAENLNLERLVAKCSECDEVFVFHVDGGTPAPRPRENIARPEQLQVERRGDETVVRRSWRNPLVATFTLFFAAMWNGFVWFAHSMTGDETFFRWFLVPFQFVGAGVAYLAIAMFVNTTTLTVSRQRLTVNHGPLPFPGKVDMDATTIDQVFVGEQFDVHRHHDSTRHSVSRSFRLQARLKSGSKKVLIRSLADADEALWLEQLIEDELGIADQPVRGEYR